jgi:hypothetical protein
MKNNLDNKYRYKEHILTRRLHYTKLESRLSLPPTFEVI